MNRNEITFAVGLLTVLSSWGVAERLGWMKMVWNKGFSVVWKFYCLILELLMFEMRFFMFLRLIIPLFWDLLLVKYFDSDIHCPK